MAAVISPQPLVEGEAIQNHTEALTKQNPKQSYAAQLQPKQSASISSIIELFPVSVIHGEPTIEFTTDEVNEFTREEGLHQAVVMKFSYGKPDLQEFKKKFSSQFDVQGRCNIGLLEFRHLLVRFDLHNDYVKFLSRSTSYVKTKGDEFFFRTFPWTLAFNPKEETSMAVVWISLPGLPPNFFAKRSLTSIASAVGKALAVDKATQERTRPSTARVKVILDLLDKHPKKVKLQIVDRISGKIVVHYQEVMYDNLPKYCTFCKHQGHDEKACRVMKEQSNNEVMAEGITTDVNLPVMEVDNIEKLQGDARDFLNAKRAAQLVDNVSNASRNFGVQHVILQPNGGQQRVTVNEKVNGDLVLANAGQKGDGEGIPNGNQTSVRVVNLTTGNNQQGIVVGDALGHVKSRFPTDIPATTVFARMYADTAGALKVNDDSAVANSGQNQLGNMAASVDKINMQEEVLNQANIRVDKGPHPPYRDVPATRALDTISNVVNPIVQAYDKLASAAAILSSGTASKGVADRVAAVTGSKIDCVEGTEQVSNVEEVIPGEDQFSKTQGREGVVTLVEGTPTGDKAANAGKTCYRRTISQTSGIEKPGYMGIELENRTGNLVGDDKGGDRNKEEEDWNVVAPIKSPTKNGLSPKKQTQGVRSNDTNIVANTNSFEILAADSEVGGDATGLSDNVLSKEVVLCPSNDKERQDNDNLTKESAARLNATKNKLVDKNLGKQAHSSNVPTLQFSSPRVEQIIREAQNAMMVNNIVNHPLVTLNTSVFEVPSQSFESCGDHGQMVLSTGKNNDIIKANVREMVSNSKIWDDQHEYDDEEDLGVDFVEDFSDGERCSGDEVVSPTCSNVKTPDFNSNSKQQGGRTNNTKDRSIVETIPGQQQQHSMASAGVNSGQQNPGAVATDGHHQQDARIPAILTEEKELLDALVSSATLNML